MLNNAHLWLARKLFIDKAPYDFFCTDIIGFNYNNLISGEYKLLLEPLAYFNVGGVLTAATAHEAALYNQILGGDLRQNISNLTHKNLPLSMFLEISDLGFPAWDGPTTEKVSAISN